LWHFLNPCGFSLIIDDYLHELVFSSQSTLLRMACIDWLIEKGFVYFYSSLETFAGIEYIDSTGPKPLPMKILVVEDEAKTAKFLKKGLNEAGFVVDVARDGLEGLHLAREVEFDLVILDIMLPSLDGWQVLAQLRKSDRRSLVLLLTARDSIRERVQGLELGADDYLVKPFAFSELLARVRSLLRRGPVRAQENFRMADLEIDLLRQRATRAGQRLDLTSKEFLLLTLLARRAGEVLSRTLIAEAVWDMNFDSDTNVVDVNVRRLRAKVDEPFPLKLIHTIRGAGYVMECD
jgi:two-component system copper resistance phosphate regulon response regulator CusR